MAELGRLDLTKRMDEKFDARIVIEDARHRHAGVVALILAMDARAMALLRLYVTIGLACAAGAVGVLLAPTPSVPPPFGWALFAVVLVLAAGSYWCFAVMRTSPINIPGRKADFWLWATRQDITTAAALQAYLENLQIKNSQNDALNAEMTQTLNRAKLAGMLSPVAAVIAGFVAALLGRLF